MEVRGPAGDWHALRANPDYMADWRVHGSVPPVMESAGFAPRDQTEADLDAGRCGLLDWEDTRERSRFKPFWIDEKMLEAEVVEAGDSVDPIGMIARATGMNVSGLHLLDGALVLRVKRGRRQHDNGSPDRVGSRPHRIVALLASLHPVAARGPRPI